nr:MAG TPA: hypothetical protein [Caudoviricetes sp.]
MQHNATLDYAILISSQAWQICRAYRLVCAGFPPPSPARDMPR